jgi:hypothetical protein
MALSSKESEYLNLLDVVQAIVTLKGRVFVAMYEVFPKVLVRKGLIRDSDIVLLSKFNGF